MLKVVKKVLKTIAKVVKKIGKFIKKYARVIVAVVAAVAIPFAVAGALGYGATIAGIGKFTLGQAIATGALAGGVSGLVSTGSLKGALQGAIFGAITAGFAKYVANVATQSIKAAKVAFESGIWSAGRYAQAISAANSLAKIKLVVGHALIGGARAVVNGGKFLTGAITGAIGKLTSFATNLINTLVENPIAQGLVVATAGGLAARLAGGSFELGFLTAGLAFAVNELVTRGFGSWKDIAGGQRRKISNEITKQAREHLRNLDNSSLESLVTANNLRSAMLDDSFDIIFNDLVPEALDSYILLPANRFGVAVESSRSFFDWITGASPANYSVLLTVNETDYSVSTVVYRNQEAILFRQYGGK